MPAAIAVVLDRKHVKTWIYPGPPKFLVMVWNAGIGPFELMPEPRPPLKKLAGTLVDPDAAQVVDGTVHLDGVETALVLADGTRHPVPDAVWPRKRNMSLDELIEKRMWAHLEQAGLGLAVGSRWDDRSRGSVDVLTLEGAEPGLVERVRARLPGLAVVEVRRASPDALAAAVRGASRLSTVELRMSMPPVDLLSVLESLPKKVSVNARFESLPANDLTRWLSLRSASLELPGRQPLELARALLDHAGSHAKVSAGFQPGSRLNIIAGGVTLGGATAWELIETKTPLPAAARIEFSCETAEDWSRIPTLAAALPGRRSVSLWSADYDSFKHQPPDAYVSPLDAAPHAPTLTLRHALAARPPAALVTSLLRESDDLYLIGSGFEPRVPQLPTEAPRLASLSIFQSGLTADDVPGLTALLSRLPGLQWLDVGQNGLDRRSLKALTGRWTLRADHQTPTPPAVPADWSAGGVRDVERFAHRWDVLDPVLTAWLGRLVDHLGAIVRTEGSEFDAAQVSLALEKLDKALRSKKLLKRLADVRAGLEGLSKDLGTGPTGAPIGAFVTRAAAAVEQVEVARKLESYWDETPKPTEAGYRKLEQRYQGTGWGPQLSDVLVRASAMRRNWDPDRMPLGWGDPEELARQEAELLALRE